MKPPNGVILYEGPSVLDGAPIVVIATGIVRKSDNSKTGGMIQTYVVRSDVHPVEAANTGADESVCGDCPLRPVNARAVKAETGASVAQCYVRKGTGVASVYRGYQRGIYPHATPAQLLEWANGRPIRFGTYGDPAAAPLWLWVQLGGNPTAGCSPANKPKTRTGYSHQWRRPGARPLRSLVMASVGSAAEQQRAVREGWRTFRVRGPLDPILPDEIICPASAEGGHKTQCETCGLCNGKTSRTDRRRNVVIIDHGPTAARTQNREREPMTV